MMRKQLHQWQPLLLVLALLAFAPLTVAAVPDDAPDLDVPPVSEEVPTATPVEGQDGLNLVFDAVTVQPIVHALLVRGPDEVPIQALETFAPVKAVPANLNPLLSQPTAQRVATDSYFTREEVKGITGHIPTGEIIGHLRLAPCPSGLPEARSFDAVLVEPMRDGALIYPVQLANVGIGQVPLVNERAEFGSSGRLTPPIVEPSARWAGLNTIGLHPSADSRLTHAVPLAYATSGQAGFVQAAEVGAL